MPSAAALVAASILKLRPLYICVSKPMNVKSDFSDELKKALETGVPHGN